MEFHLDCLTEFHLGHSMDCLTEFQLDCSTEFHLGSWKDPDWGQCSGSQKDPDWGWYSGSQKDPDWGQLMDCSMEFHLDPSAEFCLGCSMDHSKEFHLDCLMATMLVLWSGSLYRFYQNTGTSRLGPDRLG